MLFRIFESWVNVDYRAFKLYNFYHTRLFDSLTKSHQCVIQLSKLSVFKIDNSFGFLKFKTKII